MNRIFEHDHAINVYEFKSRVTVEFNRVTNKFEVIKESKIIGEYSQSTPAYMRADYENSI